MGKYFGTVGVRGIAGDTLTSGTAYRIGRFIGQYPNGAKNKILIGQDTRKSGFMLYSSLSGGITSSGGDVFNLGVTTSPSISYLVKNGGFDYGIMITASHNPFYDNGIKIFSPEGEKIKSSVEDLIEYYIDFGNQNNEIPNMSGADIGIITYAFELRKKYVKFLKNHAKVYPNYKILIDCGNGSASDIAPEIFSKEFGVHSAFIINFPNRISINKLCRAAHIACLQEEILKEKGKYDFGLAFDGDADRLMIVDGEGNIVDGDKIIYLCAQNMIKENRLPDNTVVITVMTNFGVKKAFKEAGINYFETQVGDRFVQAKMKASGYMLGREQS